MRERKDYIYFNDQQINSSDKVISYDFSNSEAEMLYCSGIAERREEVVLTNGEVERLATVSSVINGVANFEFTEEPRPVQELHFSKQA